jgi:threonine synthase
MKYNSLNNPSELTTFDQATIRGQAPDGGLYFPEAIPALPDDLLDNIATLSNAELAFRIISPYTGDTIPESELRRIVAETIDFDFPLVPISPGPGAPVTPISPASTTPAGPSPAPHIWALELFHGPTLAFKDVGARFMSRCLAWFTRQNPRPITVLVATSGDTGSAVASGFYKVEGVRVVILYPSGKVSSVQEQQLTTLGDNIIALEVEGSFDDCQRMVKQAFSDPTLRDRLFLTSANSINVARWLPQQFYYFFAWRQWPDKDHPPVISVPSGNFGNLCAGLIAWQSGLPVEHFIAACNANDIVPSYLRTGEYHTAAAKQTLSNAMDVGNPSNFVRILEIFHHRLPGLQKMLTGYSISDQETADAIRQLYTQSHYLADPHGAIGWLALDRYLKDHPGHRGIFLETAHPVKFFDTVEPIIGEKLPLPPQVAAIMGKPKQSLKLPPLYEDLKAFLLS